MFDTESLHLALKADLGRTKQPTENSTSSHYAAFLLQKNITRKYTDGSTSKQAENAALEKFQAVNESVSRWSEPPGGSFASKVIDRAIKLFDQQSREADGSPRLTLVKSFNVGMVGPGAAIDATADNFVDKLFNSKLTCTKPVLFAAYRGAIRDHKPWWKAERARSHLWGDYQIVQGNKMFYVPKDTIIARTAATEPTLNMFGQKGAGHLIEKILLKFHDIELSKQENINRWMARSGSASQNYATIDLSSASDTIGRKLVSRLLPSSVNTVLNVLRSPVTIVGNKKIELNMVSTMGNGFTFPMQTWIFATLVLSVMLELKEPIFDQYGKRRYAVYGDDIICPSGIYDKVTDVLHACGFTVNMNKSFSSGSFRESCGGDYWKGVNVRAIYLHKYTNGSHGYSLINRLLDWSGIHKIPLPNTMKYLRSLVQFRPIPLNEVETAGIRVPLAFLRHRKVNEYGHLLYWPCLQNEVKIEPEKRTVEKFYHAFHVATLHGSFSGGRIMPRILEGHETFKVIRKGYPIFWDFSSDARLTSEERVATFELNMHL